jgi:acyl-coenzyme A thioesterase 13
MANDTADQVGLQVSLLQQLRVTAAEPGRVEFELDIQKEHTVGCGDTVRFSSPWLTMCTKNRLNIIHGGTIASMGLPFCTLSNKHYD